MAQNRKKRRRRRRRQSKAAVVLVIICIAIIIAIAALIVNLTVKSDNKDVSGNSSSIVSEIDPSSGESSEVSDTDDTPEETPTSTPTPTPTLAPAITLSPDSINSVYGYMVRVSDGSVVLDKNASAQMYPASMTKVMTLLVAIEHLTDLDEKLQISTATIAHCIDEHASVAGFSEGEYVKVRDLLYGIMLPSGADACLTIVNKVAGSEEAFAELMNQKAAELGLTNTHFTNSTGLHDDNQYTTCIDMAKLFETALENPLFYQIATTASYKCEPTEYHPDGIQLVSSLYGGLGGVYNMENGAVILGGKTGTTDEAGYCLVSFGTYNDQIYIMVTGLGQFNDQGIHYNMTDAVTAYSALR